MTENELDFVLDGNAAAGALCEVFCAADVTTAHIQCDACGSCLPVRVVRVQRDSVACFTRSVFIA